MAADEPELLYSKELIAIYIIPTINFVVLVLVVLQLCTITGKGSMVSVQVQVQGSWLVLLALSGICRRISIGFGCWIYPFIAWRTRICHT